jgi:formiminotetrahydrofolate cyclodeaminase
MVGQLTFGKRQWESLDSQMRQYIPIFDKASKEMIDYIDDDTEAFNDYMVLFLNTLIFLEKNKSFLGCHEITENN